MGRVALVTGAGSGIGAACAARLESDGMRVVATDLRGNALRMDVTDEAEVEAAFDAAEREHGAVAVLVTCAGTFIAPPGRRPGLADIDVATWEQTFRVNTLGTFLPLRAMMRRRTAAPVDHARIVTISSAAGQTGGARGGADYAASKAAVLALTKMAAREAAPLRMTVNSVAPGPVETPLFRSVNPPERDAAMLAGIPLGRIADPSEIAAAVAFLVSEAAGYVTGSVVDVNGGSRMQ